MKTLLLATTNPDKLTEISSILQGLPYTLLTLESYPDVLAPEETGETFDENARAKAAYYARCTGQLVVAEDSGLAIDALDGAPGVQSARYGGVGSTYPEKFARLYGELRARNAMGSTARFVCAVALMRGSQLLFETKGTVEGCIADEPAGHGGFGYDPIFFYPPFGRTLAEVGEKKAIVSHRGHAFRALRAFLEGKSER